MDHTMSRVEHFTIYCHTNTVNGKKYIGQTSTTMEKRWQQHLYEASIPRLRRLFLAAIHKYGADAFIHEVLETAATQDAANLAEIYWIDRYNTIKPNGYNLDSGGGRHPETRKKVSAGLSAYLAALSPEARSRRTQKQWESMTPEQRAKRNTKISAGRKAFMAALSPEERSRLARKANAAKTPAARSRIGKIASRAAQKAHTPEQRSEIARKRDAAMPPELRSERSRKAWAARTPEQRSEQARKARAALTPEQRSEAARKGVAALTQEQRNERSKKTWETRKARYGKLGRANAGKYSRDASKKGWAKLTPEAHAERVRKTQESAKLNRARAKEKDGCAP
jgi:group I intron endonuclease